MCIFGRLQAVVVLTLTPCECRLRMIGKVQTVVMLTQCGIKTCMIGRIQGCGGNPSRVQVVHDWQDLDGGYVKPIPMLLQDAHDSISSSSTVVDEQTSA